MHLLIFRKPVLTCMNDQELANLYCIAGNLHGVQLLWMSSFHHEPIILMDVLFVTWRFCAGVTGTFVYWQTSFALLHFHCNVIIPLHL